jgi:glycerol-3-phosphate dehydrogenase subunit B
VSYDTVVVGAGLAGLTAALRLAEQGQRVLVVARGVGATHLAPATVDVLGYAGDQRVESPAASLPTLLASSREHPYRLVSDAQLRAALEWFRGHCAGLGYDGSLDENLLLPTALGVAKPSTLVPRTMSHGDLRTGGRYVFVGFQGFKDFYPSLIADNIMRAHLPVPVTARALDLEPPAGRTGDLSGRVLAERFDTHQLGDWLVEALREKLDPDERVGVPAVLGLRNADATWQRLEGRLERRVFEIPTLPPSIPGIRLFNELTAQLRAAGSRIVLGARVVGARTSARRIDAVEVASGAGTTLYPAQSVVLASGGFASGGLELDSYGATRETVFDLPLTGVQGADRIRFLPNYFDTQPLSTAGVSVDGSLRPVDAKGGHVYANLHAAGAILAGAIPWQEKSGTGISVATGYAAAQAISAPSVAPVAEQVR